MQCFGSQCFLPFVVILVLSYFVALSSTKTESQTLKKYAKFIIAVLLLAAVIFVACALRKVISCGGMNCMPEGGIAPKGICPKMDTMR